MSISARPLLLVEGARRFKFRRKIVRGREDRALRPQRQASKDHTAQTRYLHYALTQRPALGPDLPLIPTMGIQTKDPKQGRSIISRKMMMHISARVEGWRICPLEKFNAAKPNGRAGLLAHFATAGIIT